MTSLSNCPEEYYQNCLNSMKLCGRCQAGDGRRSDKLRYEARDPSLPKHPFAIDQTKSKRIKTAQKVEQGIQDSIIRGTLRSGAAFGDGDHHLVNGEIRQEVKDRGARKSWNLTWDEWQKGERQGIQTYAISIVCPDGKRRTLFMMNEDLFNMFVISQLKNDK